jgi:hypothetical protein
MPNEIRQRRKEKLEAIGRIMDRAEGMGIMLQTQNPRATLMMDLDYALDDIQIKKLETFEDESFAHDIIGIQRYMNRDRLTLEDDMFVPRCW